MSWRCAEPDGPVKKHQLLLLLPRSMLVRGISLVAYLSMVRFAGHLQLKGLTPPAAWAYVCTLPLLTNRQLVVRRCSVRKVDCGKVGTSWLNESRQLPLFYREPVAACCDYPSCACQDH